MENQLLSIDYLRSILNYNPSTGIFRWYKKRGRTPRSMVAGSVNPVCGHRVIIINQNRYKAHRLAWLYVYGSWPPFEIDHINGLPDDNRIFNLRLIEARWQQRANQKIRKDNRSGFKGVRLKGKKYTARCKKHGIVTEIQGFSTPEEAHAAYIKMALKTFGDFARAE